MTYTTRRYLPAILLGATVGVASALVLEANAAAPILTDDAKQAIGKKPAASTISSERGRVLLAKAREPGVSTYTCPSSVAIGADTSFGRGSFAFTSASVRTSACGSLGDLAPASARGGHCMTCSYEKGITLNRSGGKDTVCWKVPGEADQMACEVVPPLPPSQTCSFEIRPPVVDLMPLGQHTAGDDDLWAGGGITTNFVKATVDAKLERGTGSNSGKLFLQIDARLHETEPDYTTFRDSKRIEIKTSHLAAGTAADIAACLGNFTENRPFETRTGRASLIAYEYEPYDLYSDPSADLKVAATCKFDSPGEDVGDVGCNPITVEPIRITLR